MICVIYKSLCMIIICCHLRAFFFVQCIAKSKSSRDEENSYFSRASKKKERESHKKPAKEVEDLGNGDDDGTGNGEIRNTCNCWKYARREGQDERAGQASVSLKYLPPCGNPPKIPPTHHALSPIPPPPPSATHPKIRLSSSYHVCYSYYPQSFIIWAAINHQMRALAVAPTPKESFYSFCGLPSGFMLIMWNAECQCMFIWEPKSVRLLQ